MNTFQTEAPAQVLHEIARSRIFGNVVWQRSVSAALKAHRPKMRLLNTGCLQFEEFFDEHFAVCHLLTSMGE
jgi:hypothetical protein